LRAPGQAFLELAEPRFDERLGLGIAIAATPVGDPTTRQVPAEVPRGELAAIVSAQRELAGLDATGKDGGLDAGDRFLVCGNAAPTTSR